MRTANFKSDVLWAVAYKKGENPPDDFLVDEGSTLASFVNTWIRKLYDQADFYDLVQIRSFTPDSNHLVAYDQPTITDISFFGERIWKVLKVYLVDPRTNRVGISTPFRLRNDGIHVGFEHGTTVWIKYIGLPPLFSADSWNTAVTYQLGDLTYSPITGQSYKSIVSNNQGNDPSLTSSTQNTGSQQTLQQFAPSSPARAAQNKIVRLSFVNVTPPPDPTDPPVLNDQWYVQVVNSDNTNLGNATQTADGSTSLAAEIAAIQATLIGVLPGTFSVTVNATNHTMDIIGPYDFNLGNTIYTRVTGNPSFMPFKILQAYVAGQSTVYPTLKQIKLTISNQQFYNGAVYSLGFMGSNGVLHTISYTALPTDSINQVISGLVTAIAGSSDTFFSSVSAAIDASGQGVTFSVPDNFSLSFNVSGTESNSWEQVLFPLCLVDAVVRGVYSDTLREEGQTDKGQAEEQAVAGEQGNRAGAEVAPNRDVITDQATPKSRYSMR